MSIQLERVNRDWGKLFKLQGRIRPPDGWRPVAKAGLLRANEGVNIDLVRLRDVADWLALSMSREDVLHRCLGRLVDDDLYPLCMSYILDPEGEPERVLDHFQASMATVTALGLPGVYYTSEPVEVAAWLLEAWWRAWPAHSEISLFVDKFDIIQRRRMAARRARLRALGLPVSDIKTDATAHLWPADEVLMASLDRLALPVFVAFDLWGYGVDTAAPAVVVDVAAVSSADNVEPLRETPPASEQATPPAPAKKESAVERQDRRLQMCIDADLPMDRAAIRRLPDGVGDIADREGVSRQTFSADVKKALQRKYPKTRPNLKSV